MQQSQPGSVPTTPWLLVPIVQLLRWTGERLRAAAGLPQSARRTALELGTALLLVGVITTSAVLGLPPLLTLSGGLALAVLFVVARSWVVVRGRRSA